MGIPVIGMPTIGIEPIGIVCIGTNVSFWAVNGVALSESADAVFAGADGAAGLLVSQSQPHESPHTGTPQPQPPH
jgi:hypothetical protein